MLGLAVFLAIFGILIVVHEFGHFIVAKWQGVRVEQFSLGFGPALWRKKKAHTDYTLNLIPLGGFVKLAGDSLGEYKGNPDEYLSKKPGQRAAIIFFGPLLNYVLGFLFFCLIFFSGYPTLTTKVGALLDGYGAEQAGMRSGDRIIAIDGKKVNTWDDLQMIIYGKELPAVVNVAFLRENKTQNLNIELKEKQLKDSIGEKRSVGLLGVSPDVTELVNVKYSAPEAMVLGAQRTWDVTVITYKAIWRMISGKLSLRESVTGPLGLYYITSKTALLGVMALLNLFALLSISLAIFNLLPLPVLDGGHLLLLLIEKARGKYLSLKIERLITQVGVTLIVTLALLVTYNDVVRLFGDKLHKIIK